METHTVMIGAIGNADSDVGDNRRSVEFQGEKLAEVSKGDTRGVKKTLYDTEKGYVVALKRWSQWFGESTTTELKGPVDQVTLSEDHPKLAREADLEEPAGLDDVL